MKKLSLVILAAMMSFSITSFAGTRAAANQTQPSGSTVTSDSMAASLSNVSADGLTVLGSAPGGGLLVSLEATQISTGNVVTVNGTAVLSNGIVTVTFADGSSVTFPA